MTQRLIAILIGCGFGAALAAVALSLRAIPPVWLACLLAVIGLISVAKYWREAAWRLVWSLALSLAAIMMVLPWPGIWMLRGADHLAAGEPFCIQVADGADYRPASAWLDFLPARLQPKIEGGLAMQFHAVLAVGSGPNPAVYNWSHGAMAWKNEAHARASPVVSCVPRLSYKGMPVFAGDAGVTGDVRRLRFAARSFTIPSRYLPVAHAASNPTLYVMVNLRETSLTSCGDVRRCPDDVAGVHLDPAPVMSWLNEPPDESTRLMDEGGHLSGRTRIDCIGGNCTQYFLYDGMLFLFHMKDADMEEWPRLQQRLIRLFDGWREN